MAYDRLPAHSTGRKVHRRASPRAPSVIPAIAAAAANSDTRFQSAADRALRPTVTEAATAVTMQRVRPRLTSSAADGTERCLMAKASAHPIKRPCACHSGLNTATVTAPLLAVTVLTANCAHIASPIAREVRVTAEAQQRSRINRGSNSG